MWKCCARFANWFCKVSKKSSIFTNFVVRFNVLVKSAPTKVMVLELVWEKTKEAPRLCGQVLPEFPNVGCKVVGDFNPPFGLKRAFRRYEPSFR